VVRRILMDRRSVEWRWNHEISPVVRAIEPMAVVIGQGLWSTM
jgi:hypothetical protein